MFRFKPEDEQTAFCASQTADGAMIMCGAAYKTQIRSTTHNIKSSDRPMCDGLMWVHVFCGGFRIPHPYHPIPPTYVRQKSFT